MNTQRDTTRRLDEEIANVGAPTRGNQVPPLEEDVNDDQAPTNPLPFTAGELRAAFIQMSQEITTQGQAATSQTQAIMVQVNREVIPRENQQVGTMCSHLRDFTRMNPLLFLGQRLKKTPKSLIKSTRFSMLWG